MDILVAQNWVYLAFTVVMFAVEVFALVEALRHRSDAYRRAGKRTKTFWSLVVGAAVLVGFLSIPLPAAIMPFFMSLIAIVATIVFLVDVRPALRGLGRGRSPRRDRNGW